ncbi:hypothetical protein PV04_05374 [Phialophora macrospora]|uniref:Zn(2)-C6 fungal-type domain-containing protein n=1 Tax=Phialophora macrospora TaxID=1851006 RepID=A0A0D2CWI9_9EURO|nr:hypothetical protein PV04_05374 [Phialophora macrospora]
MGKNVRRTFDACWTCRRRRVSCDGSAPTCSSCRRLSLNCEGYSVRLVWVDGKKGMYESRSRRTLNYLSTWAGQSPYTPAQVDHLVDPESEDGCCRCTLHTAGCNPFRILRPIDACSEPAATPSSDSASDVSTVEWPSTPIWQTPSLNRPWMESMLLNHYVNHVAYLMMPVDSEANPWRCIYPSIAVHHSSQASKSLHDALLSQSAFHLTVLHADNHDLAQEYKLYARKRHYSALKTLRASLDYQLDDFTACAAALLTLAQIEGCYSSEHHEWRTHFLGVAGLLTLFSPDSPWTKSSDAWVISQSLALCFEIAHTGLIASSGRAQITDSLLERLSQVGHVGYTIGASSEVIQSISKIRQLAEAQSCGESATEIDIRSGKILVEINASDSTLSVTQPVENRQEYLRSLHQRMFRNAAMIYLYRTIYNVVPDTIRDRVSQVLGDAMKFLDMGGGSISLWPVFIAAVETCTEQERDAVKRWLNYSCKLGIGNRHSARRIIEEVWRRRDQEARSGCTPVDNIAVDWRQVQSELQIDILLL